MTQVLRSHEKWKQALGWQNWQGFLEKNDAERQKNRFLDFHSESAKMRESEASFYIGPDLNYIKEQGSEGEFVSKWELYGTSSYFCVDWIIQEQN